jgi:hypothetical protein
MLQADDDQTGNTKYTNRRKADKQKHQDEH